MPLFSMLSSKTLDKPGAPTKQDSSVKARIASMERQVIDKDDISKVSTAFLVFFLVYYGGQCYARYYKMYNACMQMAGDVQCWVGLARVYFPTATPDILWNLSRHMVASVYFLYFELGGLASDGGRVITEAEWSVLFRSSLISASVRAAGPCTSATLSRSPGALAIAPPRVLRVRVRSDSSTPARVRRCSLGPQERKVLEKYRGSRFFLMQSWALRLASDQCAKPDTVKGADIRELEKYALSLREAGSEITNLLKQPVPFPMYHMLMQMVSVNLIVMA